MAVKRDDNFQLSDILTGTARCDQCRTWHWPADRHVPENPGIETVTVGDAVVRLTRALGRGGQGAVLAGRTTTGRDVVVKATVASVDDLAEEVELYRKLRLTEADELLHRQFVAEHGLRGMPLPLLLGFATTMSPRYSALAAVSMAGPSLHRVHERMRESGCAFSGVNIAHVMTCVTAALEYLAGQGGMVHADVKPENICIGPPGRTGDVVLIDMGIVHETKFRPDVIDSDAFTGTPDYASLVQYRGWQPSFLGDLEGLFYTLVYCVGKLPFHGLRTTEALALREFITPWSRVASHSRKEATEAARRLLLLAGVPTTSSAYAPLMQFGATIYAHADHGPMTIGHRSEQFGEFYTRWIQEHSDYRENDGEYASPSEFYAEIRRRSAIPAAYSPAFDDTGEATPVLDGVRMWLDANPAPTLVSVLLAAHAGVWTRVKTDIGRQVCPGTIAYICEHAPSAVWSHRMETMADTLSPTSWAGMNTAVGLRRLLWKIPDPATSLVPDGILILAFKHPHLLPDFHALVPSLPIAAYMRCDNFDDYDTWGPWLRSGEFADTCAARGDSTVEKIVALGRVFAEYGYAWSNVTPTQLKCLDIFYNGIKPIMNMRDRDEFTMYARQIPGWRDIVQRYATEGNYEQFSVKQIHAEIARRANAM